jgi:hypothetical protein
MSKNAVVIPIYRAQFDEAEAHSIRQVSEVLAKHDIYFVGPHHLSDFLSQLVAQVDKKIRVKTFPNQYFESIAGYNSLMLSMRFYQAFDRYQYMLLAQTDSFVFFDRLEDWAARGYSYIGAPWFEGYTTPTQPLRFTAVGNGGFSLRSVADFTRVLSRPRVFRNVLMDGWPGNFLSITYRFFKDYWSFVYRNIHLNVKVNEDLFWGLFVPKACTDFRVPPPEEAIAFAFEANPEYSYGLNEEQLPFGCHAWQRYSPEFWKAIFSKHGITYPVKNQ